MIFLMCSRKSPFSSLARMDGLVVIPAGKPRSSASSISSRFAESTKIFMACPPRSGDLLRHRPVVVAAVAGFLEEPAPALRIRIGGGGQLPPLELFPLLLGEPGVHLHVPMPPAHALDLAQGLDTRLAPEVVDGVDREHEVEGAVAKGQPLGGAAYQEGADVLHGVLEGIGGDVETHHPDARHHAPEVVEEKALGASHVEHAVAAGQPVVVAEPLGDGHPAPVIAVAAIALAAVPVEVLRPEPLRDLALGGHRRRPRGDVPAGPRVPVEGTYFT